MDASNHQMALKMKILGNGSDSTFADAKRIPLLGTTTQIGAVSNIP
jgi:hypothetical protein